MLQQKRQRILDALNQMDVIESGGGEDAYVLVENNKENRQILTDAGIPLKTALKYGDDDNLCILALAFSEGYATWYTGSKLIYHDVSVNDIREHLYKQISKHKRNKQFDLANELEQVLAWIAGGDCTQE